MSQRGYVIPQSNQECVAGLKKCAVPSPHEAQQSLSSLARSSEGKIADLYTFLDTVKTAKGVFLLFL